MLWSFKVVPLISNFGMLPQKRKPSSNCFILFYYYYYEGGDNWQKKVILVLELYGTVQDQSYGKIGRDPQFGIGWCDTCHSVGAKIAYYSNPIGQYIIGDELSASTTIGIIICLFNFFITYTLGWERWKN